MAATGGWRRRGGAVGGDADGRLLVSSGGEPRAVGASPRTGSSEEVPGGRLEPLPCSDTMLLAGRSWDRHQMEDGVAYPSRGGVEPEGSRVEVRRGRPRAFLSPESRAIVARPDASRLRQSLDDGGEGEFAVSRRALCTSLERKSEGKSGGTGSSRWETHAVRGRSEVVLRSDAYLWDLRPIQLVRDATRVARAMEWRRGGEDEGEAEGGRYNETPRPRSTTDRPTDRPTDRVEEVC